MLIIVNWELTLKNHGKLLSLVQETDCILNMNGVKKIDSTGMGELIQAYKKAEKLTVICSKSDILELFKRTKIDNFINVQKSF